VIAGTATAVAGSVAGSKQQAAQHKAAAQQAQVDAAVQDALAQQAAQQQVAAEQAIPAPAAGGGAAGDMIEQLKKLAELHEAGMLTDEEFEALKAKVLAG
jgi:hypothetical protein